MKRLSGLALGALLALLVGCAVWAVRVARHYPAAQIELSRVKLATLDAATEQRLRSLKDKVFLTYYVSSRSELPSEMRRMESQVRELFETLRRFAPERIDYEIVDPKSHPDFERFAAKRKASPVRVRSIERDNYSERTIWSTLTIALGSHPPALINGLGSAQIANLQALIRAHLDQLEQPRKPVVLLAPTEGFNELRDGLAERAEVRRFDLGSQLPLPLEADALFWMDPGPVAPARLKELERFVETGRSVVLAGSTYALNASATASGVVVQCAPTRFAAEEVLSRFGLRPVAGCVLENRFREPIDVGGQPVDVPFQLRCIAPNQDFHALRGQPNGNLLFYSATALALDGDELERQGLRGEILATTSDQTWLQPLPPAGSTQPLSAFDPAHGEAAPKQSLMIALRSDDPTRGLFIAAGSSTPFQDGFYKREGTAHWRLLRTLLDNAVSDERLAQAAVGVLRPAPLPELSGAGRLLWRLLCQFLLPAALLALALARGAFGRGATKTVAQLRASRELRSLALRAAAGLALVCTATAAVRWSAAAADLSDEGLNQLAPETRAIAAEARNLTVELCFSATDRLPPSLRAPVARVREALRALRRAGADLEIRDLEPEASDEASRAKLAAQGLFPVQISTRDEEVTTVRSVYSALRLSSGARSELLRFPDAAAFEALEFRLAFALWRIEKGRRPSVAFASDVPRKSAAEAFDLQREGLMAPMGTDVYGDAREYLRSCDFDVRHLNPRDPKLAEPVDALVWLQPRRAVEPMFELLVSHLHHGGKALLAAQHFYIVPKQFRGTNFKFNPWPRPESPDVEQFYFPEIGVQLVRQPFFDALNFSARIEHEVKKSQQFDVSWQECALPFLVRAAAANFAAGSPVTANLGDQALPFTSFFELDQAKLAAAGLSAKPLIRSSERAWSFEWTGGWIPDALLRWPPAADKKADGTPIEPVLREHVPLAIELEGRFPYPAKRIYVPLVRDEKGQALDPQPEPPPYPSASEDPAIEGGRLVFFGSSELFKNHRLHDPQFRADQLLLNAVASLALPPELARVASRRPVQRGFGLVEPAARLRWRLIVLGAFPLALLAFGLARGLALRARRIA